MTDEEREYRRALVEALDSLEVPSFEWPPFPREQREALERLRDIIDGWLMR